LAVHDEIVVECDERDVRAVKEWLVRCMKEGMASVLGEDPRMEPPIVRT